MNENFYEAAFPTPNGQFFGMGLRDYFAAKAMQSCLVDTGCMVDQNHCDLIARYAYKVADAMLEARNNEQI